MAFKFRSERRLNWSSVNYLFSALCTPASESIVESVHKLKPGHILTASARNGVQIQIGTPAQLEFGQLSFQRAVHAGFGEYCRKRSQIEARPHTDGIGAEWRSN